MSNQNFKPILLTDEEIKSFGKDQTMDYVSVYKKFLGEDLYMVHPELVEKMFPLLYENAPSIRIDINEPHFIVIRIYSFNNLVAVERQGCETTLYITGEKLKNLLY